MNFEVRYSIDLILTKIVRAKRIHHSSFVIPMFHRSGGLWPKKSQSDQCQKLCSYYNVESATVPIPLIEGRARWPRPTFPKYAVSLETRSFRELGHFILTPDT